MATTNFTRFSPLFAPKLAPKSEKKGYYTLQTDDFID